MLSIFVVRRAGICFIFGLLMFITCTSSDQETVVPKPYDILNNRDNLKDSTYSIVYRKALSESISSGDFKTAATVLIAKGDALDYYLKYDSTYITDGIDLISIFADKLGRDDKKAINYYIGSQYDFGGKQSLSQKWLQDAINQSSNPTHDTYVGYAYLILSDQYKIMSRLDSSQYFSYQALEVFENTKDTVNISGIQYSLFRISSSMNDLVSAKEALDKMIHYAKISADTINLAMAYGGIAMRFGISNGDDKNLSVYSDSLDALLHSWSESHPDFEFTNTYLKGYLYFKNGDITNMEKHINQCDSISEQKNRYEVYRLEELNLLLSSLKEEILDDKRVNNWIQTSLDNKDYFRGTNQLLTLTENYEKKNDYKNAYKNLRLSYQYRDSLWNDKLKGRLYEFEKKYQSIKKEQTIAEQKQAIVRRNTWIGILSLLFITVLLTMLAYHNRRKRKSAEREQQLQEEYTHRLLQNTEDERSRIAGDLHDSVNHQLLQLSKKTETGNPINKGELLSVMEQVRTISHNLHPVMFEQVGLEGSIEELCRNVMERTSIKIITQIDYDGNLNAKLELQIYRIIEEAMNNIIKHSQATNVIVSLSSYADSLEVKVKDNGKGFNVKNQEPRKTGFGLTNIRQRAKTIKGKINYTSTPSGTAMNLVVNK